MSTTISLLKQKIPVFTSQFKGAAEIPYFCTEVAQMLRQQPLFTGKGSIVKECKVISMQQPLDAKICAIFNRNAREILGDECSWHIHDFGYADDPLFDLADRKVPPGVSLWLYERLNPCSLKILKACYELIFQSMTFGWKKTEIRESKDFSFFTKANTLFSEDELITLVAKRLGISAHVQCRREPPTPPGYVFGSLCLSVRAAALGAVAKQFGFQFHR